LIGGVIKYFRFSWHYVLWEISYTNLTMLLATIPTYDDGKKKEEITDLKDIFKDFE